MPLEMNDVQTCIHDGLHRVRNLLALAHDIKLLGNITQEQRIESYPSTPNELLRKHLKPQKTFTHLYQSIDRNRLFNSLDDQ